MKHKALIVVRRYGYYVNIVPNDPDMLSMWVHNNVPFCSQERFEKQRRQLENRGFSFTPCTGKDVADIRVYSRMKARK
ncbi:MAG: hypothetical protein KBT00_08425 [Bacteroidales bacterium]|nr:hypothetical protein [Candidatus Cacconaster merdequi]